MLQQKIIFQGVISAALVLAVDFSLGYAGWSVNIGIPVVVIATNITIFVFMMVRRRDWRSYIMPQLELTLIAAVELLLVSLEVVTWKLLTLVAVFTVLVQLFGIFVIGGRSTTLELNRRRVSPCANRLPVEPVRQVLKRPFLSQGLSGWQLPS